MKKELYSREELKAIMNASHGSDEKFNDAIESREAKKALELFQQVSAMDFEFILGYTTTIGTDEKVYLSDARVMVVGQRKGRNDLAEYAFEIWRNNEDKIVFTSRKSFQYIDQPRKTEIRNQLKKVIPEPNNMKSPTDRKMRDWLTFNISLVNRITEEDNKKIKAVEEKIAEVEGEKDAQITRGTNRFHAEIKRGKINYTLSIDLKTGDINESVKVEYGNNNLKSFNEITESFK